ncbi:MAG: HAD-IC family P-type ATPase, partial [Bacteroidia bacterium]|nr:HAD-IC family P-type ATPase [Bacteroidia bacterium]MDW8335027.1 HAD-IC family P-type ATPase [Bacteroidia bacterium]
MTRRAIYGVTGMTCLSCAQSAEEALKNVRGVREAKVYFAGKAAEIEFDPEATDFERLRQALVPLGYTLVADRRQIAVEHRRFMSRLGYKVVLAVALTVPLWVAHMLGKELPGAPWVALALNGWVAFYCGWGFFASAYEQLKRRSPGMDVLVALGAGAAWVYDLSFALTGRQGHLESAAVIVAFVLTGKWIEEWAKAQADDPRERLSVLQVETARKIDDAGRENLISVAELEPGMRARVLPGERFPADGRLLEGETYADESMLTGEFEPTFKKRHDTVWGGTLNLSQPVVIQVEAKYAESAVEKIIREVETAESVRAPMQRWMDVLAARFVPGVAALSVAAFIGTYFWGEGGWTGALRTMLTVMVASCPCALCLAAPVA